jgi:hypothetical protein
VNRKHGGAIVDMGNVIIAHWLSNISPENFDTIDYNAIPEVPDAIESLAKLHTLFGGNVTVVYKATNTATDKIINWMVHHHFRKRTGILYERVIRTLNGRDKTEHIAQSSRGFQGTTVVVDDRLEVLRYFIGIVPNLFLFRPQAQEIAQFNTNNEMSRVHVVQTWKEISGILRI